MTKKKKLKTSQIFYIISGILLAVLLASIFGLLPMAVIGAELTREGMNLTLKDITERNAILIFITIVSALIGVFLQSKGK